MPAQHYDLVVIGAGSGGIGAALSAARQGISVLLVEKYDSIGGTSTLGGVCCWEMGAGGTAIPFDIYKRLKTIPNAIGIYSFGRHLVWQTPQEAIAYPGGEEVIDPERKYLDTLQRHGTKGMHEDEQKCREIWHGLPFEPEAFCKVVEQMLAETGNCELAKNTAFVDANCKDNHLLSLTLSDGRTVTADTYVDASADGVLCAAVGCTMLQGRESKEQFNEPNAPDTPNDEINGVSLIYRVTPTGINAVQGLTADISDQCWWAQRFPVAAINHMPSGDLMINPLPIMEGREFAAMSYDDAYSECQRRTLAHWHHSQTIFPEFQGYRLKSMSPQIGVRETRRVLCEYMLTQNDLFAGYSNQNHPDIIALADHAMDTHGSHSAGCGEFTQPYGVPFRSLIPKGFDNLLVACRAAGFTALAASSCRLSRTMIQLGQAAGTAAAIAKKLNSTVTSVPADQLQKELLNQHVQLHHPMPQDLRQHLSQE